MNAFGKSQSIKRLEDVRLLTGRGRFVDDIAPAEGLHACFLRSPVAHAEIAALDTAEARAAPGVHLVLTADELKAAGLDISLSASTVANRDGSRGAAPRRPALAEGRVRFVGEPVAMVVADTLAQARDAAEMILFEYDALPAHIELAAGGPALHPDVAPENVAFDWTLGDEDAVARAFVEAAHRVKHRVVHNRIISNPMEPRGCFAEWDGARLHFCFSGQGVWTLKPQLAQALNLAPEDIHVTNPDVGGAFGTKTMAYPEYFPVAQAARILGRPVRWIADRTEAMLADNAGRDLVSTAELAFDSDLRMTAYRVTTLSNLGAYNSAFGQSMQSTLFSKVLTGVYGIPHAFVNARGIYTNTMQVDAYRGAGRPEAITTLERTVDFAARQLGLDPWEMRRRNFIPADAFPYRTPSGELYDVGEFPRILDRVRRESTADDFAARRAEAQASGRLRGLGLCFYIESILGDPTEGATVEFHADGTVSLYVGTQSNGQGHETVYAGFLADRTGIPLDAIRVVMGDSDLIARGGGTGGSRSVTVQSVATAETVRRMVEAFLPFVAEELEVAPETLRFDEGAFRSEASNRTPTLLEAAALARARGRTDLLRHHAETRLPGRSFPNGAHVAEVEIDPETGKVELRRYTVTDDFGNILHPMLVEGQVHGGIAQGAGQALWENAVHDENGQLLTASFMDYAMPRATDLPFFRFTTESVPSTANPLGMKGCGEAGTVGSIAAVSNAVLDALWGEGVRDVEMPLTPARVWTWLQEARANRAA